MEHKTGNWDCRMIFPDANGHLDFGESTRALIQFLSGDTATAGMNVGDTFQLWEGGTIARGQITKILKPQPDASGYATKRGDPER